MATSRSTSVGALASGARTVTITLGTATLSVVSSAIAWASGATGASSVRRAGAGRAGIHANSRSIIALVAAGSKRPATNSVALAGT